jgi:hypothetical protein
MYNMKQSWWSICITLLFRKKFDLKVLYVFFFKHSEGKHLTNEQILKWLSFLNVFKLFWLVWASKVSTSQQDQSQNQSSRNLFEKRFCQETDYMENKTMSLQDTSSTHSNRMEKHGSLVFFILAERLWFMKFHITTSKTLWCLSCHLFGVSKY